jgi:hypothetical protein
MPTWSTLEELRNAASRIVAEKFAEEGREINIDRLLADAMAWRDLREVFEAEGLEKELHSMAEGKGKGAPLAKRLSNLHARVEGLRVIQEAATAEAPETCTDQLIRRWEMDRHDAGRLRDLVGLYGAVLRRTDPGKVRALPADAGALVRRLEPQALEEYIGDLHDYQESLEPLKLLLPDTLKRKLEQQDPTVMLPQSWTQALTDASHFAWAAERFEMVGRTVLADVARVFWMQARLMESPAKSQVFLREKAAEIRAVLDRVSARERELAPLAEFADMLRNAAGWLRVAASRDPLLSPAERAEEFRKAEEEFQRCANLTLRGFSAVVAWMRAQATQGPEREAIEWQALERVNELLAESAVQEDLVARLSGMAGLLSLPANWKLSKGDLTGAIEAAAMARSMARVSMQAAREKLRPELEEIRKHLADPHLGEEERQQIGLVQRTLAGIAEGMDSQVFACELIMLAAQAKLAEARGDYGEAQRLYHLAAQHQRNLQDRLRQLFGAVFEPAAGGALAVQTPENEARAVYFEGMALLNRGDQSLMDGDYANAVKCYLEAKTPFGRATELWASEAQRLADAGGEALEKAWRECATNAGRLRYCDARVEGAVGDQEAAQNHPREAAVRFHRAAAIYGELLAGATGKEDDRNNQLFSGSEEFCRARWMLELSRANRQHGQANWEEGIRLLEAASLRFAGIGETRWSLYVRALRLHYESLAMWESAQATGPERGLLLQQQCQARAQEAAAILRQVGAERQARDLEIWALSRTAAPVFPRGAALLPKPIDLLPGPAGQAGEAAPAFSAGGAEGVAIENQNRQEAQAAAWKRSGEELAALREQGRLTLEEYAAFRANVEQETQTLRPPPVSLTIQPAAGTLPPARGRLLRHLRVVVASPGDVAFERDAVKEALAEVNRDIARDQGLELEYWGWDTDTHPGFHPLGPQGLVDEAMQIETSDVLIGIFANRFGTPTLEAQSGTEHEIRRAIEVWRKHGAPNIMLYFNERPPVANSTTDAEQRLKVLKFRDEMTKCGLLGAYRGKTRIREKVRSDLILLVKRLAGPAAATKTSGAVN